jgi:hypothetical protein
VTNADGRDTARYRVSFEVHSPDSKQPYYNTIFNEGNMPVVLSALPDSVYEELSERVGTVIDHFMETQSMFVEIAKKVAAWPHKPGEHPLVDLARVALAQAGVSE